jgi:hypothetical protein
MISKLERGVSKETAGIVALAIACGVRPEWLSDDIEPMSYPEPDPSDPLSGREIHILETASRGELDRFEVWLDDDVSTCDGLCLGMGGTREEAIESAIKDLQETILELRAMGGTG